MSNQLTLDDARVQEHLRKQKSRPPVEELSIDHVKGILPAEWIRDTVRLDYGVDMRVELVAGEEVTGLEFSIQLKATDHLKTRGGDAVHRCKASAAEYYLRRPEPMMYVVYDAQADLAYWLWVKPYLKGLDEERPEWREHETVQIRIPQLSVRTALSVDEIEAYVRGWWKDAVPEVGGSEDHDPRAPNTF